MFGFSRGAFTAKFLARMIHTVGLLCKGNEEMVPFAYRLYQRYLAGEVEDFKDTSSSRYHRKPAWKAEKGEKKTHSQPNGNHETAPEYHGYEYEMARDEITAFSNTFCRKEHTDADGIMEETNVKVYFLGIWDCVNSVSVLEREAPMPVPVKGTARYVRHAVAVDECRVKFKPALVAQDIRSATQSNEDIKEVWFPGCHGDIGGGWPSEVDHHIADNTTSRRERFKKLWLTRKAKAATKSGLTDAFQLSDIPLAWMMREIELVGEADPSAALSWCPHADSYKRRYRENREEALRGVMHHSLHFGSGTGVFSVMMWKCLGKQMSRLVQGERAAITNCNTEYVPFITRWELEDDEWVRTRFPLNKGDTRDIPHDAVLHESLIWRLRNLVAYCPQNNHGGQLPPCLKQQGLVASVTPLVLDENGDDADHQTYVFTANEGYENGGHSSRASK